MLASMHENQTSILDLPLDVFLTLYENNDKIETVNACENCFWKNGMCDNCSLGADYDLEINAILKTHDYIKGLLSIRSNKKYTMTYIYDNGSKEKYIYYAE